MASIHWAKANWAFLSPVLLLRGNLCLLLKANGQMGTGSPATPTFCIQQIVLHASFWFPSPSRCTIPPEGISKRLISREVAAWKIRTPIFPTDEYLQWLDGSPFSSSGRFSSKKSLIWSSTFLVKPCQVGRSRQFTTTLRRFDLVCLTRSSASLLHHHQSYLLLEGKDDREIERPGQEPLHEYPGEDSFLTSVRLNFVGGSFTVPNGLRRK